jgi:peptidoglycan/xylan/chitin deacetylase (PgdA/CDA1 family)
MTLAKLMQLVAIATGLLAHSIVSASGPAVVAKAEQKLWPEAINTPAGFDKASRASILTYLVVLKELQGLSDAQMLERFKIKSVNRASVEKWIASEQLLSHSNFQRAAKNCTPGDWTCVQSADFQELLGNAGRVKTPASLLAWQENLQGFSRSYLSEQLRLAALFPKISSEIDRFNDGEWNGDALADREFYLSFDDGPTAASGSTDSTLKMLSANKKSAVFFLLGANLEARLKATNASALASAYAGQCVASHGWSHVSHASGDQWQSSVIRTHSLLNTVFSPSKGQILPLFRPPYGQRSADSGAFFKAQSLQVALWNLDSQDWNAQVSSFDVVNRMLTLMLIKRHGVLLFHDIHPKANSALPGMFEALGGSVEWGACGDLG